MTFQNNHSSTFFFQQMKVLLSKCADINHQIVTIQNRRVHFVTCIGLSNATYINEVIIPSLADYLTIKTIQQKNANLLNEWNFLYKTTFIQPDELTNQVFDGNLILYFEKEQELYTIQTSEHPQRQPQEAITETSLRGARDGFIEEIDVNVALIRKRLRTDALTYKKFLIGKRSKTKVGLLYMNDIANPSMIRLVEEKLHAIDIDALISSTQLEELFSERKFPLFPYFDYTERPDYATQLLLNGRFIIVVDQSPSVISGPVNLLLLTKSPEDAHTFYLLATMQRMFRFLSIVVAIALPAFWVALTTYHQDQLPLPLLGTIITSRHGIPVNAPLEMFVLMIIFELVREAGLRLPSIAAQSLGIIGGIIIGDAAIRAGLVSPSFLVVAATSAVASFTLINQALVGSVTFLRFSLLFASAFLGLFGFFTSLFFIITYTANIRSFFLPYLTPISPLHFKDLVKALVRIPAAKISKRSDSFLLLDKTKKGKK